MQSTGKQSSNVTWSSFTQCLICHCTVPSRSRGVQWLVHIWNYFRSGFPCEHHAWTIKYQHRRNTQIITACSQCLPIGTAYGCETLPSQSTFKKILSCKANMEITSTKPKPLCSLSSRLTVRTVYLSLLCQYYNEIFFFGYVIYSPCIPRTN